MQAFSTHNDVLPGFIRASDQAVNVEHQLSAALSNNGDCVTSRTEKQFLHKEHANKGDEEAFESIAPQAATLVLNAPSGLHGGTAALCLQIPPLAMGGTTHRSPLVPETLVTSSTLTPRDVELINPNPLTFNSDVTCKFIEIEGLIQRIPGMPTPIKKSKMTSFADSPFVDAIKLVETPR
ncbi:hypothetical protein ACOSQ4_017115 [Xanthoceras sorbifolium]